MKAIRSIILGCAVLGAAQAGAQTLPSDPTPSCVVTPQMFSSWFASGTPTVNGVVNPADSIAFQPSSNCAFFQWSEQMFMWLNSPAPSNYGGTGPVFDSNVFYQVVPDPTTGKLVFISNPTSGQLKFNIRTAQAGAHGLPVILDNKNVLHEIKPTPVSKSGKQMIAGPGGKLVEIASAKLGANGQPILLDAKGKQIKPQLKAMLSQVNGRPSFVQQINVGKTSVFLDEFGFPIIPDQGQAGGGGVLVGQNGQPLNGSLVYYATFTNDVFTYFLTQVKSANGGNTPANTFFPTTQADIDSIQAYALKHGVKFPDPNALAMEIKTSWVAVSNPDPSKYVTLSAIVPVYQANSGNTQWTPVGSKLVTLALVGMHVVGSLTGHPEMAWSTFELFGNAPNATYSYINTSNQTVTVQQNTNGNWFFCQTNCAGAFNAELAKYVSPNIVAAAPPAPIAPSNTLRQKAFGAALGTAPNAGVTSDAQSNSEVIAINNSVLGQILNGDVRKNYYMVGSTWTTSGAVPNGAYSPSTPTNTEIGTSQLQNATMETYQQGTSNTWSPTTNCFGCHNASTNPSKTTVEVSHIWPNLTPLSLN